MSFYQQTSSDSFVDDGGNDFPRTAALVTSNIKKIQSNVEKIQRLVQQLGTPQDTEQMRHDLHEQQHSTNEVARQTNQMMKRLMEMPQQNDQRQQRLQMDRLRNDLIVVLNNLQAAQRSAASKEKASVVRARASINDTANITNAFQDDFQTQTLPAAQQPFDDGYGATSNLSEQQQLQIERNVDVSTLREREGAIKQLESDIVGLNDVFRDLALMVHEQGDTIDSIEQNVEQATVSVDHGATEVQKALKYQQSARKKKVLLSLFCVAVVIIVIVVLIIELPGSD